MKSTNLSKNDFTAVARLLTDKFIDLLSGDDEEALFGRKPSDIVMLGMMKAEVAMTNESGDRVYASEEKKFESVPAIGMTFKTAAKQVELHLKGRLYYRAKPTFEEQTANLVKKYSRSEGKDFKNLNELKAYFKEKADADPGYIYPNEELMYLYRSLDLSALLPVFLIDLEKFEESISATNERIGALLASACDELFSLSFCFKKTFRPIVDWFDQPSFEGAVNSAATNIKPNWEIRAVGEVVQEENGERHVSLQIMNGTPSIPLKEAFDTTVYNGGLDVKSDIPFSPIRLNSLKHDYLNPSLIYAIGINCSVDYSDPTYLKTTNIPSYEQKRTKPNPLYDENVTFEALLIDPLKNLRRISDGLKESIKEYEKQIDEEKNGTSPNYIKRFSDEIFSLQCESKRFENGILLIERKTIVRQAFDLMNKTMALNSRYKGWRLFQIVFIVSEIPDIGYSEFKGSPFFESNTIDNVDLIYFPTGGGKTEAFFGCSVFTAFFDRLRGKRSNTSVFVKYPLRLLSSQQLDRLVYLTMNANVVKKQNNVPGDPFTVGFFTGSTNTPNIIKADMATHYEEAGSDLLNEEVRQIDSCPRCHGPVQLKFDRNSWCLKHVCEHCGTIPVLIIDDDIYRYPPTFVVSTIDKLANIGTSVGFKSLLGNDLGVCPKHGRVFKRGRRCGVPGCVEHVDAIEVKDPVPTLFIQDELHLVNESLGTFDSHYESFLQYYCEQLVPKPTRKKIKYIAATATISDYESHCFNLYYKNARCFPASVKGKNFYSYVDEDDLNRIIVGAAFYGGSITDCVQRAITFMRELILRMMADKEGNYLKEAKQQGFTGDSDGLKTVLNDYLVSIIYNISKNDAGNVQAAIENQGNNYLKSHGCPEFRIDEISGDKDFIAVKNIMHDIESVDKKLDTTNLIVATSSISHGVDEDCFNQIFFYGMPNKTSEYIQAYSRVGRKYTGIVFDVIRLARDRDQSYLKNFDGFHRYKDLLIEPVPINRWAKNAVYSTLPGILSALLLQALVMDYRAISVTKRIKDGTITLPTLKETVCNIYGCDGNSSANIYKKIIEEEVENIFYGFSSNTDAEILIGDLIARNNSKMKKPMTSLRDVDIALSIKLGGDGK